MNNPWYTNDLVIPADFEYLRPSEEMDLSNCDREPVQHIPGIQQGSYLYIAAITPTGSDLTPHGVSANISEITGMPDDKILAMPVTEFLGPEIFNRVSDHLKTDPSGIIELRGTGVFGYGGKELGLRIHVSGKFCLVELETIDPEPSHSAILMDLLETATAVSGAQEFANQAVSILKRNTGLDRICLYRFDDSYNGKVIAEARNEELPPFLNTWFPSSDIPLPARVVMLKRPIGVVSDHRAPGVRLVFHTSPGEVPDLSRIAFREPSRMCSQYYENIGSPGAVTASMIHRERLWGFFSAQHGQSITLNTRQRREWEAFCRSFIVLYHEKLASEQRQTTWFLQQRREEVLNELEKAPSVNWALKKLPNLHEIIPSDGAALIRPMEVTLSGRAPNESFCRNLADWLKKHHSNTDIYTNRNLASVYPEAQKISGLASGILALPTGHDNSSYLIWFRGEVAMDFDWAGEPIKPIDPTDKEGQRLLPRSSFAIWKQQMVAFRMNGVPTKWN